jgi:hypothetical protein
MSAFAQTLTGTGMKNYSLYSMSNIQISHYLGAWCGSHNFNIIPQYADSLNLSKNKLCSLQNQ